MSFSSSYQTLFDTKEDADCTFIIQNKELQAHQFILCLRSPVFKAMIKGDLAPADQRHVIADPKITYEDFENFVKYLYLDQLNMEQMPLESVDKLLHLSNMYDVDLLFYDCVTTILEHLNEENILLYAELGVLYNDRCALLTKCLNHLFEHLPNIVVPTPLEITQDNTGPPLLSYDVLDKATNETKVVLISPELVLELVRRCSVTEEVTQEALFHSVFQWIIEKCKEEDVALNPQNVNKLFAPLWFHFKFEELKATTLKNYVYDYEMIPPKQLLKIYHSHFNMVHKDEDFADDDDDDDDAEDEDYVELETSEDE